MVKLYVKFCIYFCVFGLEEESKLAGCHSEYRHLGVAEAKIVSKVFYFIF